MTLRDSCADSAARLREMGAIAKVAVLNQGGYFNKVLCQIFSIDSPRLELLDARGIGYVAVFTEFKKFDR